jgi:translation elongation factor EF-4
LRHPYRVVKPHSTWTDLRILPRLAEKVIPRQLFQVSIQAAIGTKIIARESLSAMKKDVTAGLYGGHYERKVSLAWKGKRSRFQRRVDGKADLEILFHWDG